MAHEKHLPPRTRPLLRYHGGKWILAPWIISHFPSHRVYTEAFGGAASVLLQKVRSYAEIYNDMDGEIVNLFRVMQDTERAGRLRELLRLTPCARKEFELSYEPTTDIVEASRRLIVRSFLGFGSDGTARLTGFRANSNRSGTTPAHDWKNYPEAIEFFIERLRAVVIECRPAIEILNQHDSTETLHYVDPPYLHSTRSHDKRYRFEMTKQQHIELSKVVRGLHGMVIVSGYPDPLYSELYGGWQTSQRASLADGARKRIEVLWMNPACFKRQAPPLFGSMASA